MPAALIICASSSTDLLPAGGVRFFRNGSPAASISIAIAKGFEARTKSIFSFIVSMFQGFTVGTAAPLHFEIAFAAAFITSGFVPSPVKAAIPASAQAAVKTSL